MDIPDIGIGIRNIGIPEARVFDLPPPVVPYTPVPITEQIGSPIVNIPGCVEFHPDGEEQLEIDDSKSVRVLCDAGYPTYRALDYVPEQLIITRPAPVPKVPPAPESPEVKAPEIPTTPIPGVKTVEEEPVEEEIPWVEAYLPTPEAATTTAAIAVVATTSALLAKPLADLLLKVIKPVVKKVITKAQKLIGKKVPIESVKDRRDQQRIRSHAIRKLKGKE